MSLRPEIERLRAKKISEEEVVSIAICSCCGRDFHLDRKRKVRKGEVLFCPKCRPKY